MFGESESSSDPKSMSPIVGYSYDVYRSSSKRVYPSSMFGENSETPENRSETVLGEDTKTECITPDSRRIPPPSSGENKTPKQNVWMLSRPCPLSIQ
jgi:hypothetical protein